MRLRGLVVACVLAGAVLPAADASAFHCSGRGTPPSEYRDRGTTTDVAGWMVHHDAEEGWVGVYYTDGYLYADASDPENVTVRGFIPFWPHFVDVYVEGDPGAEPCVEVGHGQP